MLVKSKRPNTCATTMIYLIYRMINDVVSLLSLVLRFFFFCFAHNYLLFFYSNLNSSHRLKAVAVLWFQVSFRNLLEEIKCLCKAIVGKQIYSIWNPVRLIHLSISAYYFSFFLRKNIHQTNFHLSSQSGRFELFRFCLIFICPYSAWI